MIPMLLLALFASVGLTGCSAQDTVPSDVRAAIVAALAPDPGQDVEIVRDSAPSLIPGVVVFRGRRLVPPYPSGEDARPVFASVVRHGSTWTLIARLSDVSNAWQALPSGSSSDPQRLLERMLTLLRLTGLITRAELIASRGEVQSKIAPSAVRDPASLSAIMAPSASRTAGATTLMFTAVKPSGVFMYTVMVSDANQLTITRELVTALIVAM